MSEPLQPNSKRITETVLILLLLLGLLYALFTVLKAFFGVFTFAIIFAVSFAKPFDRLVKLFGQRRKLAAVVYSILLIAVIAVPVIYMISALSLHVKEAIHWIGNARENGLPPLPGWITNIPFIGDDIDAFWQQLQERPKETVGAYEPQLRMLLHRVVTSGAGMLGVALEFIAGIIVSAVFLVSGRKIMVPVRTTLTHMFGKENGYALVDATAQAVKGVAIGVMGTAFIAAVASWIGFAIEGIPFALGLAAIVYFLVLIQVGPLIVFIPVVVWLAMQGHSGGAIFIAIWGVAVLIVDAVLKPVLIARSGKLPFLVLFLGVIGGLVAWGFTGMFKGAIILAVFYTIFNSWLEKAKGEKINN
ncbi:AI-2E family transporter [Pinibacter aurantiacus]|uniref:AI-2E family transporter n=1 Tax=Pinibacter aurantiacus TaxID=2851599 RepID=A0A9E2W9J7_9BACT|nr:AI-2E family transporter [Pinibacter aurantiacus]MBV4360151.1 AI-2E family transporter [Pinibacter aurantiacus]